MLLSSSRQELKSRIAIGDPLREPAWRYERVLYLTPPQKARKRLSKQDDDYVRRFRRLLVANNHSDLNRAIIADPDMYCAWRIHDNRDHILRSYIDARLLARQDDLDIASRCSTSPGAIDCYEKMFFNVRDRLDSSDWVMNLIHGFHGNRGILSATESLSDTDRTLRFFAYYGGIFILEALISQWYSLNIPVSFEQMDKFLDEQFARTLKFKSSVAAQWFEANQLNVMQLFDIHCRLMEVIAKIEGNNSADGIGESNAKKIQVMLKHANYLFAPSEIAADQQKYLPGSSNLHLEYREEELVAGYAGEKVGFDKSWKDFSFSGQNRDDEKIQITTEQTDGENLQP